MFADGVSPLISIFAHLLRSSRRPREIHFLYASKATAQLDPQTILFLPRLVDLVAAAPDPGVTLSLFLTGTGERGEARIEHGKFPNRTFARRIADRDVVQAVDGFGQTEPAERATTLCYVCGPPGMTDGFVEVLTGLEGMGEERVLCEKWW